jgi:cysteine desulfurase / selenocysteine lyase
VTGVIQPIEQICEIARGANVLTLVDAAQTVGHTTVSVNHCPIDLLACPGHKGLLGPLGTGVLYVRTGLEESLVPSRVGGTGTHSDDDRQPEAMPDRFEAGNHNAPGIAGLAAALNELQERSIDAIQHHEQELTSRLVEGLRELSNVTVYGHQPTAPHVGVVSFNIEGFTPHEVASILDESFGIQARAGLHCAPGVHRFLGTFEQGGTVRFSVGAFTTTVEIEQALASVRELAVT